MDGRWVTPGPSGSRGHPWVQDGRVPSGPRACSWPHVALVPCVPSTGLSGGTWSCASPCSTQIWQNRLGLGRATHSAGRAPGQGSHPALSPWRHGHGQAWPGIATPMVAQPHVPQHCHLNRGVAMAMCPPASPRLWWHLHGHMSPSITMPMVARPWPYVPLASPPSWWHLDGHVSPSITMPMVARP